MSTLLAYAISPAERASMICPTCGARMEDVTESWHTFAEAEGAEYLSSYVTIWYCASCGAVAGGSADGIEWLMEREETSR